MGVEEKCGWSGSSDCVYYPKILLYRQTPGQKIHENPTVELYGPCKHCGEERVISPEFSKKLYAEGSHQDKLAYSRMLIDAKFLFK
jgi:hypothetical protein